MSFTGSEFIGYLVAPVLLHDVVEVDGADDVVAVVHLRVRHALRHRLQPGEVYHGVVPGDQSQVNSMNRLAIGKSKSTDRSIDPTTTTSWRRTPSPDHP